MISFSCSQCGKSLRVKDELAGKKGKCPQCDQALQVPLATVSAAGPVATHALPVRASRTTAPADVQVLPPPREPTTTGGDAPTRHPPGKGPDTGRPGPAEEETASTRHPPDAPQPSLLPGEQAPDPELYDFLAPAQEPNEIGRLGPYRILKVLGAGGMGVVFQGEDPQLSAQGGDQGHAAHPGRQHDVAETIPARGAGRGRYRTRSHRGHLPGG